MRRWSVAISVDPGFSIKYVFDLLPVSPIQLLLCPNLLEIFPGNKIKVRSVILWMVKYIRKK